jgi:hypothetical protein
MEGRKSKETRRTKERSEGVRHHRPAAMPRLFHSGANTFTCRDLFVKNAHLTPTKGNKTQHGNDTANVRNKTKHLGSQQQKQEQRLRMVSPHRKQTGQGAIVTGGSGGAAYMKSHGLVHYDI